jgi:tetratricopeptide (TPR) repeat protein
MASNGSLFDDLRAHIANRDVLVLVGAGVSVAATKGHAVAQWKGLLHHGLERCKAVCALSDDWLVNKQRDLNSDDMDDLFSVAEIVASKLGAPSGGEYRRWLRESVGALRAVDRTVLEALRDLKLPIGTTNYDGLIEESTGWPPVTWQDGAKVERVLRGSDQGVLHLHGFWDRPETVILGIRDYARILGDVHAQSVQKAIRTTRTLLFVGCGDGLRDPNFGSVLKWTEQVFAGSEYRHFRLAPAPEVDSLRKLHPPEQRIFVLSYGENHSGLGPFLRALAPTGAPPAPAAVGNRGARLPAVGYCFGRDDLVSELVATLLEADPPPTAILGGPGHGKTTISLKALHDPRVASRYGARRFFVRCEGARTRDALAGEVALAMGLEPGPNLGVRAFAELERKRAALVLDNIETPWEADTLATEDLLGQLSSVRALCLIVSVRGLQRPQGVAWGEPVGVPPLDLAAARQAFLAVAGQVFDSDPRLEDLLNAVDRVPLAITLLAYQGEGQPNLNSLWERWQAERTKILQRAGGTHRLNNLDLSLELSVSGPRMDDAARCLLSLLGVLPDGIAWADLDALLPGQGTAAAADLRRVGLAFDDGKSARLRALAPVRDFAHYGLAPGEVERARCINYYLALVAELGEKVGAEGGAEAVMRLTPEIGNLEAMIHLGLEASILTRSVDAACGLGELIRFTGLGTPLALETARDVAHSRGDALSEARCLRRLGDIALGRLDHDRALGLLELALRLYRGNGDVLGEAGCLFRLGIAAQIRPDQEEAQKYFESALPLFRRASEIHGEANCVLRLGVMALERSDRDVARGRLESALSLFRQVGGTLGEANCIYRLGFLAHGLSDHKEARGRYESALSLYRSVGDIVGEANCMVGLGDLARQRSEPDEARRRYEAALPLYRRIGSVLGEANCTQGLGDIAGERSDLDQARSCYEQSLEQYGKIPDPRSIGGSHRRLARIAADDDRRREHVRAARAAWSSIKRADLIEELDGEFGRSSQAESEA